MGSKGRGGRDSLDASTIRSRKGLSFYVQATTSLYLLALFVDRITHLLYLPARIFHCLAERQKGNSRDDAAFCSGL